MTLKLAPLNGPVMLAFGSGAVKFTTGGVVSTGGAAIRLTFAVLVVTLLLLSVQRAVIVCSPAPVMLSDLVRVECRAKLRLRSRRRHCQP